MTKYYLHLEDPNGNTDDIYDLNSDTPEKAKEAALSVLDSQSRDRDWHYSECQWDDRWTKATLLLVKGIEELDVKPTLKAAEDDLKRRSEQFRESQERAQYEALKKKFEK